MADPNLSNLLKWSIANSASSKETNGDAPQRSAADASTSTGGLDAKMLAALLGGPSDADLMREAMTAVLSSDVDMDNKLIAFENLQLLIENIDNANNLGSLGMWTPLVELLASKESELRRMSAWCLGTAVQNNDKAQERCLIVGAIPRLVQVALCDDNQAVRKKAIFALSAEARNYQPGLDELVKELPKDYIPNRKLDAAEMDDVDVIIVKMREEVTSVVSNGNGT